MKQVFRTTKKYWATQEGFGLFLFCSVSIWCWWATFYWFSVICFLLGGLAVASIRKLQRSRIEIDEHEIASITRQGVIQIAWRDVLAIRVEQLAPAIKVLQLWTAEHEIGIPLQQFDQKSILQLAEKFAPPVAWTEDAVLNTPAYKQALAELDEQVSNLEYPLQVKDSWIVKGAGWVLLCCFMPLTILMIFQQAFLLAALLLIFVGLGLIVVLNTGSLEVDQFSLTRKTFLGTYQMRWDEVEWIEHHEQESTMLLCSANKQLAIPSPAYSSGQDWNAYVALLTTIPKQRGITMKRTWEVLFKWSKNTRVRA